jgi:hypothetical protein
MSLQEACDMSLGYISASACQSPGYNYGDSQKLHHLIWETLEALGKPDTHPATFTFALTAALITTLSKAEIVDSPRTIQ